MWSTLPVLGYQGTAEIFAWLLRVSMHILAGRCKHSHQLHVVFCRRPLFLSQGWSRLWGRSTWCAPWWRQWHQGVMRCWGVTLRWQHGDTSRSPHRGRDADLEGTGSTEPLFQFWSCKKTIEIPVRDVNVVRTWEIFMHSGNILGSYGIALRLNATVQI